MAITSKLIKVEEITTIAQDYNPKIDKKVDKLEGHGLYPDVDKTKLAGIDEGAQKNNITSVKVNNQAQTIGEDGTLNLDIESVIGTEFVKPDDLNTQLEDYAKTEDIQSTYATKAEMTALGTIQGSCEQADLEDKKASAGVNDCWIVTDDDNHLYYYNGEDFVDTGAACDVDLTPYLKSADADGKFATQTELEKKADQSAVDSLTSTMEGKLAESDLTFATTAEVKAALKAGETPAV